MQLIDFSPVSWVIFSLETLGSFARCAIYQSIIIIIIRFNTNLT